MHFDFVGFIFQDVNHFLLIVDDRLLFTVSLFEFVLRTKFKGFKIELHSLTVEERPSVVMTQLVLKHGNFSSRLILHNSSVGSDERNR